MKIIIILFCISINVIAGEWKIREGLNLKEEVPAGKSINEISQIFRIDAYYGLNKRSGTGFFVSHNNRKYIITAGHNMEHTTEINIYKSNESQSLDVKLGRYIIDGEIDIAVIEVETEESYLLLHDKLDLDSIPTYGTLYSQNKEFTPMKIEIYGYPKSWGFRVVDGIIYQKMKYFGDKHFFLTSTGYGDSGMSGGPWVCSETKKVIGVHTRKLKISVNEDITSGSGAVPINTIYDIIEKLESTRE